MLIPVGYTYEEKNRPPLTLLEDLANPAEGCSLQTLLPPPRPQISLPSHLSSAPRVCDPRATTQPIIEILDEQPSPSPRAVPLPGCIQEGKTTPVSSRDHQRKDKEDSREMPHSPSGPESGNLPLALVTSFSGRVYHPLSSLTGSSVTQPFHSSFSCQRQLNIQD